MSGKSELRIFDDVLPQVVVDHGYFVDIQPSTGFNENSTNLEFNIRASDTEYLDLNDTLLYIKLKVMGANNTNLAAAAAVLPANYFMNALFKDITLSLNDTIIEGGNHMYSYKSTIESIFNFTRETKQLQLECMGYNETADERKKWIATSKVCELMGALRLDFFNQPKYLLPGINVRLSLTRSNDKFALQGGGTSNPTINIMEAKMYVRRVRVNPDVVKGHELGLVKKNAIYPYTRGQTITYTIPQGSHSHFHNNLFSSSLLPKFVVVGFVKSTAFNGDGLDDSPFKFEDFKVLSIGLFRDGQSLPYRDLYNPNFKDALCVKAYMKSIIHNTQHLNTNFNNGISYEQFCNGTYALFTFNLTPDFDMTQTQYPRDGNLSLEIKFKSALAASINVIVYGTFDTQIQITKDRKIIGSHVH